MIQNKQFLTIILIVFCGFLGISMPYLIFPSLFLNPAYSILPETWGASSRAILLGVTLAAYPLGQFIGSPVLGSLSDDYGRKKLLAGSLLLNAGANILAGFSIQLHLVGFLIFSRFFSGFMEGNVAIARAMASEMKSIPKHYSFGVINAAVSIAFLLGPLLGGILTDANFYEGLNMSTPFYLTSFLFILLSFGSILTIEDNASNERSINSQSILERFNLIKRLSLLFKNKRLKFLLITSTAFTLAVDIFYEFGPVYLTAKWMLEPVQLTLYNVMLCFGLAVGNGWLSSYIIKHLTKRQSIILSASSLALFIFGIVLTSSTWVMLFLFTTIGLAIGIVVTLFTVKISDSVSDAVQGEVMGVQISLRVLWDAVICLLGGFLLLISSKVILVISAMIAAATVLYYIRNTTSTGTIPSETF